MQQVQQVTDSRFRKVDAEVLGGNFIHHVAFIENDMVIRRQEPCAMGAQGEVGTEQRMIADEQIAVFHPPPGCLIEAFIVRGTLPAHAVVGV